MTKIEQFRIAALSDIHTIPERVERLSNLFTIMSKDHEAIVVTGDLMHRGNNQEIDLVSQVFRHSRVPVIACLGNHDLFFHPAGYICHQLERRSQVRVLNNTKLVLNKGPRALNIVGMIGFDGGFEATDTLSHQTQYRQWCQQQLTELEGHLQNDPSDTLVLTHFSPIQETLIGEKVSYTGLGNRLIGQTIDRYADRVKMILHGHAHLGSPAGSTQAGIPVRNVAVQVLMRHFPNQLPFLSLEF